MCSPSGPRSLSVFSRDSLSYGFNQPDTVLYTHPWAPPLPCHVPHLITSQNKLSISPLPYPFCHPACQSTHLRARLPHPNSLCPALLLHPKALAWLRLRPPPLDHCISLPPGLPPQYPCGWPPRDPSASRAAPAPPCSEPPPAQWRKAQPLSLAAREFLSWSSPGASSLTNHPNCPLLPTHFMQLHAATTHTAPTAWEVCFPYPT